MSRRCRCLLHIQEIILKSLVHVSQLFFFLNNFFYNLIFTNQGTCCKTKPMCSRIITNKRLLLVNAPRINRSEVGSFPSRWSTVIFSIDYADSKEIFLFCWSLYILKLEENSVSKQPTTGYGSHKTSLKWNQDPLLKQNRSLQKSIHTEFIDYLVTDYAAVNSLCSQISGAFTHHLQCSLFNFYFHAPTCPVSVSVAESGSSDSD